MLDQLIASIRNVADQSSEWEQVGTPDFAKALSDIAAALEELTERIRDLKYGPEY